MVKIFQKSSPLPTPPPSPEKVTQMLEKLKKYETEISEMSKEVSKVNMLQSQLDASMEEVKHGSERGNKLRASNIALEEKVQLLETEVEEMSSRLLVAEQQALHENANMMRMKEEWNEKTKMLQQAHETNVRIYLIYRLLYQDCFYCKTHSKVRACYYLYFAGDS